MLRKSAFLLVALACVSNAKALTFTIECHSRYDHPEIGKYVRLDWDGAILSLYRRPFQANTAAEPDLTVYPQRTSSNRETLADNRVAKNYLFADDKEGNWFTINMSPGERDRWVLTYTIAWMISERNGQFMRSAQTYSYRNCSLQESPT
ncbi:Hypothetical protein BN117_0484 [Bordetella parapertussis Bpp5]|uniref:Lipoprotein n=1 Tax=Bordetella parapertussis (strain Bpp5) TaxID=1208660 RepID=K0M841_BORPB|nr:Hypothetical protein BN117_0484 [Bordetella parapertussis Bpp5]